MILKNVTLAGNIRNPGVRKPGMRMRGEKTEREIIVHHNNGIESKQIQHKMNIFAKNILIIANFIEILEIRIPKIQQAFGKNTTKINASIFTLDFFFQYFIIF
jgi:hypothetical protein